MKTYIGFSRDHSRSMSHLAESARVDYNNQIEAIKEAAIQNKQDTIVSTVKCGVGDRGAVVRETINSSIAALEPITRYVTDGYSTPLFDSVDELIGIMKDVPDANDPGVAFLVNVITDGENNSSKISGHTLAEKIRKLQATDRWTFTFRVPFGGKRVLTSFGIPEGNILEWEQTKAGIERASFDTIAATQSFYAARARGVTSTKGFYTSNLSNLKAKDLKDQAIDITSKVKFIGPTKRSGEMLDVIMSANLSFKKGCAFYELTKTESNVQDYKKICILNKTTRKVYAGAGTRAILGLPDYGNVKLVPGNHGDYDIFIQSTSTNRKVLAGTRVLYWADANN